MKIQIDVDGVLADFRYGAWRLAHQIDPSIPKETSLTVSNWDLTWPLDVSREVWKQIKTLPLFWHDLPSLIDRDDWMSLRRLGKINNEIYFVTSRVGETAKWQTEGWLYDRLERNATVVVTPDKAGFARLVHPDYAIEDNGTNASKISQVIGPDRSYIIDRLYNQDLHPMAATRVKTVKEFLGRINGS